MDNLKIKTTNIELTDAISDYVVEKMFALEKLTDSKDESVHFDVEVGKSTNHHKSGDIFKAEINLHIARNDFRTTSEKDNLYAAIDEAKDDMMRTLKNHKDKKDSLMKRGALKFKEGLRGEDG